MKIHRILLSTLILILFISFTATYSSAQSIVSISLDYKKQFGMASNQFAVWIEDSRGKHVKTLYVTEFTSGNRGFEKRPGSVPLWVSSSGVRNWTQKKIDGVSRATPKSSRILLTWNFTDQNGKRVSPGVYRYRIEAVVKWAKRVIYTGNIRYGKKTGISQPVVETFPRGERFEQNMISNVKVNRAK